MGCCSSKVSSSTQGYHINSVDLSHFDLLRSVGKGAFGKVRVVQHKASKKIYALKYINKEKCIQMKAVDNIIQERKLLEEIHNPFVCNLRYAFQDDENLFMVIDLMLGGDLRFHLDRRGVLSTKSLQLLTAEVSFALSYMHSKNIVHRDLKPDNILLDEFGHFHLTDFNIAVRFKPEKPLTAVAGSLAYMAPEILNPAKVGYFSGVDWWSLGVILYEMSIGRRPFRCKTTEALTQAILADEVEYPEEKPLDDDLLELIKGLLVRDVKHRLGTKEMGGFDKIKQLAFLSDIDWELLEEKQIQPDFVPSNKETNFDATHELEELLLEDNPLRARQRKVKHDAPIPEDETPTQRDNRVMDTCYTDYDFTKRAKDGDRPLADLSLEESFEPVKFEASVSKKEEEKSQ